MSEKSLTRRAALHPAGRDGLPSLTGLRFFAAGFVVCYHLVRQVGPVTEASYLAWYGRSGVTFFFVLSGVVLAWTYARNMPALRIFWWRRFARIWPLHVAATALSVAVYIALGTPVSSQEVLGALALVHAWSSDPLVVRGGNGATWSLSDEAFFYLCFPFLLAWLSRSLRPVRQAIVTLVVVMAGLAATWVAVGLFVDRPAVRVWSTDYFPPVRALEFLVGVAFGIALARGWRPKLSLPAAIAVFAVFHIGLFFWMQAVPDSSPWGAYSASQLFSVPVYLFIVLAAATRDLDGRSGWLGHSWLVRLGHWSFAWYLVHEIIVRCVLAVTGRPVGLAETATIWLLVILVSQALAGVLYRYIEHPAERHLRAMVQRAPSPDPDVRPLPTPAN